MRRAAAHLEHDTEHALSAERYGYKASRAHLCLQLIGYDVVERFGERSAADQRKDGGVGHAEVPRGPRLVRSVVFG